MIVCHLFDYSTKKILLSQVYLTETATERMTGLLGTKMLDQNSGLLIHPCNSVHTLFMKYSIDVIYLDKNNVIKKIVCHLKPWNFSWCFKSKTTLELAAGAAKKLNLKTGQKLIWKND